MNTGIKISLPQEEINRFRSWTAGLSAELRNKVKDIIVDTLTTIERESKQSAPVSKSLKVKVGGRLRSSIHFRITPSHYGGDVTVNVKYGPYVEWGTGKYVRVLPGYEDYAMQFKGRGIRKVNIRPQPYFFENWEKAKKNLIKELKDMGFK